MYTCCIVYIMCCILLYICSIHGVVYDINYNPYVYMVCCAVVNKFIHLSYLTLNTTLCTLYYIYYTIYSQEVYKHGMVEANFSPQNKLLRLEMAFDVMSFMQQLRRSSGRYDFQVCRICVYVCIYSIVVVVYIVY